MSTPLEDAKAVVPLLLELAADIDAGRISEAIAVSKKLAGFAVDLIPVDALKDSLTDRDRRWIDLSVDIAEEIKLAAIEDEANGMGPEAA